MKTLFAQLVILVLAFVNPTFAQYPEWKHTGSLFIITTPEGADLPPTTLIENFPLLVRLDKNWFDFQQTQSNGNDLRFSSSAGQPLLYQIEEWNAADGAASVWVRVPKITGNARQEIKLHWGNPNAASESDGQAVFNASNGYASVWHMGQTVKDEVGNVTSKDEGTTATSGIIATARHLAGGQGIFGGDDIDSYPSGTGPMSTEAWFRAEKSNGNVLAWGKEQRPGKVMMQFESPPSIAIRCYFADVEAATPLSIDQWYHVVHTYQDRDSRVYVNGRLEGASTPELDIPPTSSLWIGGWYGNYNFVGDIDEVRISKLARSPEWVKLQYENQKPMQTTVGPLSQPGTEFSVSVDEISLSEGQRATVTAQAGGAQKVYWILKHDDQETVVAVDRFDYEIVAGRVVGDTSMTLQLKAVYDNEVKTQDVRIKVFETIPEPIFQLESPPAWDGRETIEVIPRISNLKALQAAGAGELAYTWAVSGLAAIKEVQPDRLVLTRALNSGDLTVTLTLDNGGAETLSTTSITVKEPVTDAWVARTPGPDEQPVDNQFYPRDDKNVGTLVCRGTLPEVADSVYLNVYADDQPYQNEKQKLGADNRYAFAIKLKPGLIKYRVEFGSIAKETETVLHTATNIVCGDAYLIEGQSNALATDWGQEKYEYSSEWIRSYGSNNGDVSQGWGNAVRREGGHFEIGCWGMDLAKSLVENHNMPICIINGAAGGTLIEAHQRNADNHTDPETIYGRLLNRVQQAGLTHGIRGVFWHQGENNQGAQGATGKYGWETYEQYFIAMAAAWKQDFPNIQHYYVFQIWPNSCSMGGNPNSDRLRDVQRQLPRLFANMTAISTLGIKPEGSCHFPPAGYAELARQVLPIVEQDNYGVSFKRSVTSPNIRRAGFSNDQQDEITLEFDQPMAWNDALISQFYLNGEAGKIAVGVVTRNVVTLKLHEPSTATAITYLIDKKWDANNLLYGQNGIAALTFFEVPLNSP